MNPTAEQQKIINTQERSVLVRAGAGTGKTKTLVDRYMSLLENNPTWSVGNIVAITFTEKAAREMRQRARERIEENAQFDPAFWNPHRRNLDQIRVSTIHGFCSQLLRENAIAAQIDPRFEVMEEAESVLLKKEAIRQTIERLAEEKHSALTLLYTLQAQDLRSEMATLLQKRGMVHLAFEKLPTVEALLEQWSDGLDKMRAALWSELRHKTPLVEEAISDLPHYEVIDESDKLVPVLRLVQEGIDRINHEQWHDAIEMWKGVKTGSGSKKNWGGDDGFKHFKALLVALRKAAEKLEKQGCAAEVGAQDEEVAHALQHWKALWNVLDETYTLLKTNRQCLDFDDLELLTFNLLDGPSKDEPRVRASLDSIKQLMVDEFQDTNELQSKIIQLITPPEENRLFLVGDEKQSIYRFRQAQVSNFTKMEEELEKLTGKKALPLSRSFRSQCALVAGCNELFEQILQPENGTTHDAFEAKPGSLKAQRTTRPFTGSVEAAIEVLVLPQKDENDENVDVTDARVWEAKLLARRIQDLHDEGYLIEKSDGGECSLHYSDVAILFRSMGSLSIYEEQLKAANIPYLVNSGKGYYDRPEIQDLIALLTALQNEGTELSLAAALRSPLFGLSDETLYRLRWRAGTEQVKNQARENQVEENAAPQLPRPLLDALLDPPLFPPADNEQGEAVAMTAAIWQELRAMVGRVEVWQLVDSVIERTAYAGTLGAADMRMGGRRVNNLQKFTAIAREKGGASLANFLLRVENLRTADVREGEAQGVEPASGAVQIMTIHASKGLEFPVVIVADLGRKLNNPNQDNILCDPSFGIVCKLSDENGDVQESVGYSYAKWQNKQMESAENKRLLYVACTRARDLLILSGQDRPNSWIEQIQAYWDLDLITHEQQLVARDFGSLQVRKPTERPDYQSTYQSSQKSDAHAGMKLIPPLALPLDPQFKAPTIAASKLLVENGTKNLPPIRPAVRRQVNDKTQKIPGYVIGNIVHMILADWESFALEQDELKRYIGNLLHRSGVVGDKRWATQRINQMVRRVRTHQLFAEIESALIRETELSFTHRVDGQTIHGQIDMLYQTRDEKWHIVDWKTDWVTPENVGEMIQTYRPQIRAYANAVAEIIGSEPTARLCFLQPNLWIETIR